MTTEKKVQKEEVDAVEKALDHAKSLYLILLRAQANADRVGLDTSAKTAKAKEIYDKVAMVERNKVNEAGAEAAEALEDLQDYQAEVSKSSDHGGLGINLNVVPSSGGGGRTNL